MDNDNLIWRWLHLKNLACMDAATPDELYELADLLSKQRTLLRNGLPDFSVQLNELAKAMKANILRRAEAISRLSPLPSARALVN